MITSSTTWTVKCDNCDYGLDADNDFIPVFDSPTDAANAAEDAGWFVGVMLTSPGPSTVRGPVICEECRPKLGHQPREEGTTDGK